MLQIASGKFFTSQARYRYNAKGVLFANYRAYVPVTTCVGTVEPVDAFGSVATYVFNYVNQMEKQGKARPGVLLRTGDWEIVEQFRLLLIVGLRAFFHHSRTAVANACRSEPTSVSDVAPRLFVPRFFENRIQGTADEQRAFRRLVNRAIGLPRDKYRVTLAAAGGFADALEVAGRNLDLAYSLLVFSLECLSPGSDMCTPTWADYPEEVTARLDPILDELEPSVGARIRGALLRERNVKLGRRFVDFVSGHVRPEFFTEDVPGGERALQGGELARALKNAYELRSGYAHRLRPIHELLRVPAMAAGDVIVWDHEPYLTLGGLTRLTQHVITTFITRQETLATEQIDWRSELPGVIHVPLAPQYWMAQHEDFQPQDATKKLEGFLQQCVAARVSGTAVTDLRELMIVLERELPHAGAVQRRRMYCLYRGYCLCVDSRARPARYVAVLKQHEDLLGECTIEAMVVLLLTEEEWPWEPRVLAKEWERYSAQQFGRRGFLMHPLLRVLVEARIAAAYLAHGSTQRHSMWSNRALLDAAGRPAVQQKLRDARRTKTAVSAEAIWEAARLDAGAPSPRTA
jgi:hypothetical protein